MGLPLCQHPKYVVLMALCMTCSLCAIFHIPVVYGLLVFVIRLNTAGNFCVARYLQKYFINISDVFFKALVGLPLSAS